MIIFLNSNFSFSNYSTIGIFIKLFYRLYSLCWSKLEKNTTSQNSPNSKYTGTLRKDFLVIFETPSTGKCGTPQRLFHKRNEIFSENINTNLHFSSIEERNIKFHSFPKNSSFWFADAKKHNVMDRFKWKNSPKGIGEVSFKISFWFII